MSERNPAMTPILRLEDGIRTVEQIGRLMIHLGESPSMIEAETLNALTLPLLSAGSYLREKFEDACVAAREPATLRPAARFKTTEMADKVDVASASMTELQIIHDKMQSLSDVAYAMSSQGCCASGRRGIMVDFNAAGDFLHWLGDELTSVESKVADEMQRRRSVSLDDQEVRLAALAGRVICNGDRDETAALMQDLSAWVNAQAER